MLLLLLLLLMTVILTIVAPFSSPRLPERPAATSLSMSSSFLSMAWDKRTVITKHCNPQFQKHKTNMNNKYTQLQHIQTRKHKKTATQRITGEHATCITNNDTYTYDINQTMYITTYASYILTAHNFKSNKQNTISRGYRAFPSVAWSLAPSSACRVLRSAFWVAIILYYHIII